MYIFGDVQLFPSRAALFTSTDQCNSISSSAYMTVVNLIIKLTFNFRKRRGCGKDKQFDVYNDYLRPTIVSLDIRRCS